MNSSGRPVALVTGAGQGIGQVIARRLGEAGYDVAVHYHDGEAAAQAIAADIRSRGQSAVALPADFTVPSAPEALVHRTVEALGGVDVVVNNAAVIQLAPFFALGAQDVDTSFQVNFRAPWCINRAAAQWMIDAGQPGSIVHITSVHQERVTDHDSLYGSLKAALARLNDSLAYELGSHGIRVNAIAPGRIRRPASPEEATLPLGSLEASWSAIPLQHAGVAEDVANAVLWLVSDAARYVTGITLRVDGGLNLAMNQALVNGELHFI